MITSLNLRRVFTDMYEFLQLHLSDFGQLGEETVKLCVNSILANMVERFADATEKKNIYASQERLSLLSADRELECLYSLFQFANSNGSLPLLI